MKSQNLKRWIPILLLLTIVGCVAKSSLENGRQELENQMLETFEDNIDRCVSDLSGLLMDEGCLEEQFRYGGDFYDCEVTQDFEVIDGDCLRSYL
ncbi:hypothetical protein A2881_05345 [Candidatus Peribacteria bacterium RIFCSPHIGHO2_01_FULL_55_13]|nr:MAG: hypothetical protein A2881_05345 [Candidatus Peribacteria bacterium RIFCSPHIGHO2_01_FULL_55_13]OGJ66563.1 MAG: hypothetical protein A3F36_02945 [Candidatus Peribacteria bacterium RIFCSPHIGHO2_12_FULL_55_11]